MQVSDPICTPQNGGPKQERWPQKDRSDPLLLVHGCLATDAVIFARPHVGREKTLRWHGALRGHQRGGCARSDRRTQRRRLEQK